MQRMQQKPQQPACRVLQLLGQGQGLVICDVPLGCQLPHNHAEGPDVALWLEKRLGK